MVFRPLGVRLACLVGRTARSKLKTVLALGGYGPAIAGPQRHPREARLEVTHVSWTVPGRHNGLRRAVSWNARNAGTIPGSSSSRRCGWLPLKTRPRPRWRENWAFG